MPIQSVDRATQILFAFSVEEPLLGITELSKKLGANQSTVHHLVQSLAAWGLVEQDPRSRKYRLGLRTIQLGGTMLRSRNLSEVVQPYLHHVADRIRETAYLGVLVNGQLLNLDQVCGPHLVQHSGWQGRITPFYCTSAGKVLAAYLPPGEQKRLLTATRLVPQTANTITDRAELERQLKLVLEQGYALNFGELEDQNNAVAVPIRGRGGSHVVAALGVVGPAYRFTKSRCMDEVPFLKSAAVEISSVLDAADFSIQLPGSFQTVPADGHADAAPEREDRTTPVSQEISAAEKI